MSTILSSRRRDHHDTFSTLTPHVRRNIILNITVEYCILRRSNCSARTALLSPISFSHFLHSKEAFINHNLCIFQVRTTRLRPKPPFLSCTSTTETMYNYLALARANINSEKGPSDSRSHTALGMHCTITGWKLHITLSLLPGLPKGRSPHPPTLAHVRQLWVSENLLHRTPHNSCWTKRARDSQPGWSLTLMNNKH